MCTPVHSVNLIVYIIYVDSPGKWDNTSIKELLDKLPKVWNIGENIYQMEWFGGRCLFLELAGEQAIQNKIPWVKCSSSGKNNVVRSLEVISISRFPTEKILAEECRKECRDFVKLYRFKTGDNFRKRYYKLVNIDFPWCVAFSCMFPKRHK